MKKALSFLLAVLGCAGAADSTTTITPTASATTTTPSASVASVPSASASVATPPPVASTTEKTTPDVVYVPSPQNVVDKMLEVAKITKTDTVYDLGCGDGRIVVTAAKKFGAKGYGFDVDPKRVAEAKANVAKEHVENLVTIEQKDIFTVDLSPATVVTLYLLPELNVRLIAQLQKLASGSRVVSHDFNMEGVDPEKTWTLQAQDHVDPKKNRDHYVYLWRAPITLKKK